MIMGSEISLGLNATFSPTEIAYRLFRLSFFLLFSTMCAITSALTAARQCKLNMSSNFSCIFAWFMFATEACFALFISLRFSENFRKIKSAKRASADQ